MPLSPQEAEKLKRLIDQMTDGDVKADVADHLNPEFTKQPDENRPESEERANNE